MASCVRLPLNELELNLYVELMFKCKCKFEGEVQVGVRSANAGVTYASNGLLCPYVHVSLV